MTQETTFKPWGTGTAPPQETAQSETIPDSTPDLEDTEETPEVDYWDNWTWPGELSDEQKAAILQIDSKEIAWGEIEIDRDTIPDPELNLSPECYMFYQYGKGLTDESIEEIQKQGVDTVYEGDLTDMVAEIKPLIDEILTRVSDFDTFDIIRTVAENFNAKYQELLDSVESGLSYDPDRGFNDIYYKRP